MRFRYVVKLLEKWIWHAELVNAGGKIEGGYEAAGILAVTENAAKAAADWLGKRYSERLRHEIAQIVATAGDVDDEIGRLFNSL